MLQQFSQKEAIRAATETKSNSERLPFRQWAATYLSERFSLPPSRLHLELSEELETLHLRRGSKLNRMAPRGGAKTSWATFAYPMYAALEKLEPHIVISADSGEQAEEYLEDIVNELQTNEKLREAYWPALRGLHSRASRLELSNGCLIRATSTGKRIRGRKWKGQRPTLIIGDDLQSLEHITSPILRQRSMAWLMKDVLKAGTPQTNVVILGTALHRECVVCQLHSDQRIRAAWNSIIYRSIQQMPTRLDLWREWEDVLFNYDDTDHLRTARAFYDSRKAEMDTGSSVLWEAREPLYELMLKRATEGVAAFNSEHQNDPIDPTMCEWPAEYLDWPGMWFDEWPKENMKKKVLGVDPSKGTDAKDGDYSAIVRVGENHQGLTFLQADMRRDRSADIICADICKHVRDWQPQEIAFETNQFQELFKPILRAIAKELDVKLPPIIDIDNRVNKELRIRRWTPDLASKAVRFKRKCAGTQIMIDQGRDFPQGSHDDGWDAAEMGRRRLKATGGFDLL